MLELLTVPAYALESRLVGMGVKLARGIGFPLLVGLAYWLQGWEGAVLAVGWCGTRSMDFKADAATPTRDKHFARAAERLWPILVMAGIVAFKHPIIIVGALAACIAQLMLSGLYGQRNADAKVPGGKPLQWWFNPLVEAGSAAIYSLCVIGALSQAVS